MSYRQYEAFVEDPDGFGNPTWWDSLQEDGLRQQKGGPGEQRVEFDNHPRETVSWYDAMAFCKWLSARLDVKDVTLPTEMQWEKAVRGMEGWEYPWGNGYREGFANIYETYQKAGQYSLSGTTAVGIYLQGLSPCGALDMSGNVWEWTSSEYRIGSERKDSSDVSSSGRRAVRRGSGNNLHFYARAACRGSYGSGARDYDVGFRLAVPVVFSESVSSGSEF